MQIPPLKVHSVDLGFRGIVMVSTGDWEAFWLGDP